MIRRLLCVREADAIREGRLGGVMARARGLTPPLAKAEARARLREPFWLLQPGTARRGFAWGFVHGYLTLARREARRAGERS